MAAPKGNQNAVGNNGGRPSHFDKRVEAEEFLKWAMTDDALVMRMFAPMRGYSFDTMTRWAEEDVEFRQVYMLCKDLIGARRELLLIKNNSASPFQRYATWYDKALQLHERDEKEFAETAKVKAAQPAAPPSKVSLKNAAAIGYLTQSD